MIFKIWEVERRISSYNLQIRLGPSSSNPSTVIESIKQLHNRYMFNSRSARRTRFHFWKLVLRADRELGGQESMHTGSKHTTGQYLAETNSRGAGTPDPNLQSRVTEWAGTLLPNEPITNCSTVYREFKMLPELYLSRSQARPTVRTRRRLSDN